MKISYTFIIFIVSLVNGQRWMQAYSEVNPELKPLLDSLFQTFGWRYDALKEKWSITTSKWYKRYEEMTQNCRFDGRSFELPTSNWSDVCQVNLKQGMIYMNNSFLRPLQMRPMHWRLGERTIRWIVLKLTGKLTTSGSKETKFS